jgi:hypothetical protein
MRPRFCSRSEKIPACAEFVQAGLIIHPIKSLRATNAPCRHSVFVLRGGRWRPVAAGDHGGHGGGFGGAAFMEASLAVGSTVEDFTSDFTDVPHLGGLSRLALTPFRLVDPDAFLSVNA